MLSRFIHRWALAAILALDPAFFLAMHRRAREPELATRRQGMERAGVADDAAGRGGGGGARNLSWKVVGREKDPTSHRTWRGGQDSGKLVKEELVVGRDGEVGEIYFLPHFTCVVSELPFFTLTSLFCHSLLW